MNQKINVRLGFDYLDPPEKLSRDQMKNLIDVLLEVDYTEREGDLLIGVFCDYCKHPGGSDVIYWPNLAGFDRELEPAEILKVAMGEPLD